MRGEITTPREMTVEYKELSEDGDVVVQTKTASDMGAVVLMHELNHILKGKTYVDCCLSELSTDDLSSMATMILKEKINLLSFSSTIKKKKLVSKEELDKSAEKAKATFSEDPLKSRYEELLERIKKEEGE